MRIFHIATAADWEQARATGSYTTSTRGRTLAEEGFIHASRGDQWQGVQERYYADVTEPLVLLAIDPDLLGSPVVEEAVPGTDETFPHVYGPIDVGAVVTVLPLGGVVRREPDPTPAPASAGGPADAAAAPASFSSLFLHELAVQLGLASLVLVCVVALTLLGLATGAEWGPIGGASLGLVLGVLVARRISRRRA